MTRAKITSVSLDDLRTFLKLEGGALHWREAPERFFRTAADCLRWNGRYAGAPVNPGRNSGGYKVVNFQNMRCPAHRAIWALHYGQWPIGAVDHVNGDRADNSIHNLRQANHRLNSQNTFLRRDNSTGFPGVQLNKTSKSRPWIARIGVAGKWRHLGCFATRDEAIACRKREQIKLGFTARHGEHRNSNSAVICDGRSRWVA